MSHVFTRNALCVLGLLCLSAWLAQSLPAQTGPSGTLDKCQNRVHVPGPVKLVTFSAWQDTTYPYDINDLGTVVGMTGYDESSHHRNYVRYADGTVTSFSVPDRPDCTARGDRTTAGATAINNTGLIVGNSWCWDFQYAMYGSPKPFLRLLDGTIIDLSGDLRDVTDINDLGEILGWRDDCPMVVRNMAGFTTCVSQQMSGRAINNSGTIVGGWSGSGLTYTGGKFESFNYKNSAGQSLPTYFIDINNAGDILGRYSEGTPPHFHSFVLRKNGRVSTFELPYIEEAPDGLGTDDGRFNSCGDVIGHFWAVTPPDIHSFIALRLAK